jgi:hypothetical protein
VFGCIAMALGPRHVAVSRIRCHGGAPLLHIRTEPEPHCRVSEFYDSSIQQLFLTHLVDLPHPHWRLKAAQEEVVLSVRSV